MHLMRQEGMNMRQNEVDTESDETSRRRAIIPEDWAKPKGPVLGHAELGACHFLGSGLAVQGQS